MEKPSYTVEINSTELDCILTCLHITKVTFEKVKVKNFLNRKAIIELDEMIAKFKLLKENK